MSFPFEGLSPVEMKEPPVAWLFSRDCEGPFFILHWEANHVCRFNPKVKKLISGISKIDGPNNSIHQRAKRNLTAVLPLFYFSIVLFLALSLHVICNQSTSLSRTDRHYVFDNVAANSPAHLNPRQILVGYDQSRADNNFHKPNHQSFDTDSYDHVEK